METQPESSSRRAEANRQNAQKSTGPRTEAGKARSARNSTRHALLARAATLMAQPNHELQSILARFNADLCPGTIQEEVLVQQMAAAAWRLRQSARLEVGLMSIQMQDTYDHLLSPPISVEWKPSAEPEESDAPELSEAGEGTRNAAMGAAWASNPAAFALLIRYHNQATRDFFRAMKHLELLRTGKAGYLPKDSPTAETIEPQPKPAPCETKPDAAVVQRTAAAAGGQTNPNISAFTSESGATSATGEPLSGERTGIFAVCEETAAAMAAK